MSNRLFQSIVLQFKESTDRMVGVIDMEGNVIACTDLPSIGGHMPQVLPALNGERDATVTADGKTLKSLGGWSIQFGYAVFVQGEDQEARLICTMAAVALNGVKSYYEEKYDKGTFIKNIITDNIMLGDIYIRAKELQLASEVCRAVFLVRAIEPIDVSLVDAVQSLFPDRQNDYVISLNENDVVLVKQVPEGTVAKDLVKIAQQIKDGVDADLKQKIMIGIGTVTDHIRDLGRIYKEAQMAIEVGKVFETERSIINYDNLGIGRLIYQLPVTLCEMFLQEVFKKNPIDALDQETLFTINKFFENNLNVSETARKLFVHRNTLVYRLEKIKKLTGLDLREFDDAITFKVSLMVKKYLVSRGVKS